MAAITFRPSLASLEFNNTKEPANAEPLNQFVTYNPISQESSNTRWKWFWKANAAITVVGFIAAATFAIMYTTVYFAVHLPLVSMIVFGAALPLSTKIIKSYMWDKSTAYVQNAAIDAQLIQHIAKIDDIELPVRLSALGVTPGIAPEKLKALFARYCYIKEEQDKFVKGAKHVFDNINSNEEIELKINKKVVKINPQNYTVEKVDFSNATDTAVFEQLLHMRYRGDDFVRQAAICNLKAAYILKLMQSPYEKRGLEEFFQFIPFNELRTVTSANARDERADILIKTKAKSYNASELYKKDTTALAREVFELPRGWFSF